MDYRHHSVFCVWLRTLSLAFCMLVRFLISGHSLTHIKAHIHTKLPYYVHALVMVFSFCNGEYETPPYFSPSMFLPSVLPALYPDHDTTVLATLQDPWAVRIRLCTGKPRLTQVGLLNLRSSPNLCPRDCPTITPSLSCPLPIHPLLIRLHRYRVFSADIHNRASLHGS